MTGRADGATNRRCGGCGTAGRTGGGDGMDGDAVEVTG
ncbi:hypothetical protein EV384_6935 [Micromonospora kangleipakensis]|uniref:Uncharacterized protein n=1 Tax=Micromonospora kangleipakensis TaxID=1077942 RepID=A0A4Q8BL09_9ACTN|nr:hypothetical protein EV384_6935 [Micromonospora kangleipakensis]